MSSSGGAPGTKSSLSPVTAHGASSAGKRTAAAEKLDGKGSREGAAKRAKAVPDRSKSRMRLTLSQKGEVLGLLKQKVPHTEIARRFGCSARLVSSIATNRTQLEKDLAAGGERSTVKSMRKGVSPKKRVSLPDPLTFPASAGSTAQEDAPPMSVPTFKVTDGSFLVTGGTQGMGLVISACIAKAGARAVTISGRTQDTGDKAIARLSGLVPSCKFHFVQADVATEDGCSRLAAEADRLMDGIDGLVNCAAWTGRATLDTTTVDIWDRMMNTNVRGPFLLVQAVSKSMRSKGRPGSIVNLSSVVAHGGIPKVSTYSVSKAALNALTKIHAYELRAARIRVNAINVGWTLTDNEHAIQRIEMESENWIKQGDKEHPMGRLLRPVDIAATVGHLLSDASAMMTGTVVDLHPEKVDNCWG